MGERLDLRARQGGVFFLLLNALNSRRCAHRRLLDQRGPTSNAEEEFSLRIQKRLSPSLVLCSRILTFSPLPDVPLYHFSHRKITGPTRKSAKGGWTPEEVGRRVFFFDVDVDVGIEKNRKKNFSSLLWSSRLADFAFDHHETLKRACEIAPAQGIEKSCSKVVPVWAPRSLFPLSLLSSSSTALSLSRRLPSFVEIGCRRKKKKKAADELDFITHSNSNSIKTSNRTTRTRSCGVPCLTTAGDAGSRLVRIRPRRSERESRPRAECTFGQTKASGVGHRFTRTLAFVLPRKKGRELHATHLFLSFLTLSLSSLSLSPQKSGGGET